MAGPPAPWLSASLVVKTRAARWQPIGFVKGGAAFDISHVSHVGLLLQQCVSNIGMFRFRKTRSQDFFALVPEMRTQDMR